MDPHLPSRRPVGPVGGAAVRTRTTVARAMRSPVSLVVAAAAGGIAALGGLGLPGALGGAVVGWVVAVVATTLRRARPRPGPDPFAVGEPWRRYVMASVRHQRRFSEACGSTPEGPLRERLTALGNRVDAAVMEVWEIAQAGNRLSRARRSIGSNTSTGDGADPVTSGARSIRDDPDARLSASIATTERRLAALDGQLGAVVNRAIEVSAAAASGADLGGVEGDLTQLVDEMEALRLALGELDGDGTAPTGDDES